MVYGYARCSTNEKLGLQDITRQYRELEQMGVKKENIFSEYESGTKTERIQLNKLLQVRFKTIYLLKSLVLLVIEFTHRLSSRQMVLKSY